MITLCIQSDYHVPGRAALIDAARKAGWNVKPIRVISSFFLMPWRAPAGDLAVYGSNAFVTRVAARFGRVLIGPPEDWFESFDANLRQSWGWFGRESASLIFYSPEGTPKWDRRFMVSVIDEEIQSISLWARGNRKMSPGQGMGHWTAGLVIGPPIPTEEPTAAMTSHEQEEARSFVVDLLARREIRLPPVFSMVFGVTTEGKTLVEFLCPACCSPFLESHAADLLPSLRRSCRRRSELSPEDRRWTIRYETRPLRERAKIGFMRLYGGSR